MDDNVRGCCLFEALGMPVPAATACGPWVRARDHADWQRWPARLEGQRGRGAERRRGGGAERQKRLGIRRCEGPGLRDWCGAGKATASPRLKTPRAQERPPAAAESGGPARTALLLTSHLPACARAGAPTRSLSAAPTTYTRQSLHCPLAVAAALGAFPSRQLRRAGCSVPCSPVHPPNSNRDAWPRPKRRAPDRALQSAHSDVASSPSSPPASLSLLQDPSLIALATPLPESHQLSASLTHPRARSLCTT